MSRSCTRPASGRPCSGLGDPLGHDCPHDRVRSCAVKGWRRKGDRLIAVFDRQEAALVRGLVRQVQEMPEVRAEETPQDELAELTGIRTGPSTAPDDPILSRLLPDFHRLDDDAPSLE